MRSLWNEDEAKRYGDDLGLRVYASRLLGRDKALVMHGGGNTSVKVREKNIFGEEEVILYVKGSGRNLDNIEPDDFSPVRLAHIQKLLQISAPSDGDMVNELATHMLRASAPAPSIESFLHGFLSFKFVDHTHADALLAVSNTVDGERRMRELYAERCVVIPYRMPGFGLAQFCAKAFTREKTDQTIGIVLLKHGVISFGDTAKQSYERMIDLVSMAEDYLKIWKAWPVAARPLRSPQWDPLAQAHLRRRISAAAGEPMLLKTVINERTLGFAQHENCAQFSQRGPITPDTVIRSKRVPLLGGDVEGYAAAYRRYFEAHEPNAKERKTMLDPAPRAVLDPGFGFAAAGRTASDTDIVAEIHDHAIDVIQSAEMLGGFEPPSAQEIFDVEYWVIEQAKLKREGKSPVFAGEIALVTGAASGIGKAAVESFLVRGAAVVGVDIDAAVESLHSGSDYLGVRCDVTDEHAVRGAIHRALLRYGGIDMLVLNAGIFGASRRIEEQTSEEWRKVMSVNLDANFALMRACHPYLKLAPRGGRIAVIGSKNVSAPGPGASAYSASKAALNQLARVAALEWGVDGIRINTLHPNAVFDTGLWTDEVLAARAKHYGMTVQQYKTRNVLKIEVTSRDVAELAAEICGPLFAKTTGAQLPVDGGDERVI